jgi:hypothetical protein
MTTNNWVEYPFEVEGINFVSKLDTAGNIYNRVRLLPEGIFAQMNKACILDVIGNPAELTKEELESELARVNEGGTQAIIALA